MKVHKMKSLELAQIQKALFELYPETSSKFDLTNSEKLFSPYHIELPTKYLTKIAEFNKTLNTIYKFKFQQFKNKKIELRDPAFNKFDFDRLEYQPSLLSCLDFHIDLKTESIKLIEANTNASGYLIGSLVYKINNFDFKPFFEKLNTMFEQSHVSNNDLFFITDVNPEQQKMYLEFLIYKEFFQKQGKELQIKNISDLNKDLESYIKTGQSLGIYNRSTDFYLEGSSQILKYYLENKINLNPNPIAYDLFAHKDNLNLWSDLSNLRNETNPPLTDNDIKTVNDFLLVSQPMQTLFKDLDEAWSLRKKYFFKPSDSYGGKATYKGSSISKKYFESAWADNFLAQEYFPATKFVDADNLEWKFDIRAYVFEDEILYSIARVYQGQITNFSQKGGGFAPITFY
jgi:hypothetical protein